ncbi:DNA-binding response regulator [Christiangramia fulva]|uniref:DNA-binding response regulator n=1 Tax=Christiangramia fulva TaxID=2126553 RepID=A0A2R3Z225_9FLAO|nr:LuxR C-terminal-related transcriptional regulator [Christiangramia fulva]AVR44331.1 DNA-binding response regulator [Christiangramia fulva]
MNRDLDKILTYWKKEYSENLENYKPYKTSPEFKHIASLLSPGHSYYYILNLHNLTLDEISPSVQKFVNKELSQISMSDLLNTALAEEMPGIAKKEAVIKDFYNRFLNPSEVRDYKLIYSYKLRDLKGLVRTMLHQATILSSTEEGKLQHVFCLHSDVSHLKINSTTDISFIHFENGKSYYNIDTSEGIFNPNASEFGGNNIQDLLTEREKEVTTMLAEGFSAREIADFLNLSGHTIRTHRRNILKKTGCSNTAELIAKCLTGGVISLN